MPDSHDARPDPTTGVSGAGAGTHRFEVAVRPDEAEQVAARLWGVGALGLWEPPGRLVAWFAERPDATALPAGGAWSIEPDRDWQADWKATIGPVQAGRFVVVPSWLADDHTPAVDEVTLVLDPGRAFGSGHHATTTLCLEVLDELDLTDRSVADVGCGTGILAIAAARRGAQVVAVDIDPDAIEVTHQNAARNDVSVTAAVGSVDALDGPSDVVVANLVTDVVAALAGALAEATGSTLICSGITVERERVATDALTRAGVRIEDRRTRDGWVVLRATPPSDPGSDPDPGSDLDPDADHRADPDHGSGPTVATDQPGARP